MTNASPDPRTGAAWRRRRAALLASSPRVCARCLSPIPLDQPVVAGHTVDVALGGDAHPLQVECVPCSTKSGGALRALLAAAAANDDRAARRAQATLDSVKPVATQRNPHGENPCATMTFGGSSLASTLARQPRQASDPPGPEHPSTEGTTDSIGTQGFPHTEFPSPTTESAHGARAPKNLSPGPILGLATSPAKALAAVGGPLAPIRHESPADGSLAPNSTRLASMAAHPSAFTANDPDRPWMAEPTADVWAVPWLDALREVPEDATWPRLMSAPHPTAVGSFGAEFVAYCERAGIALRWWQQLAATRLLEHDAEGGLCWLVFLVSTSRQVGKSVLLRKLAMWRIRQAPRFGEEQLVVHTGKDLAVCREVQRPERVWARVNAMHGFSARDTNGQEEVSAPDGSRWIIRGRESCYGYSASMPMVDEAWAVDPRIVDDGLEPTMLERLNPQLILTSTAHRRATALFPSRRAAAIDSLALPDDVLLVEWSAEPDAEITDEAAWRAASPHWTDRRRRLLKSKVTRALAGAGDVESEDDDPVEAFRSQYLNIWTPPTRRLRLRDEPLLNVSTWDACADLGARPTPGTLVVAVEDYYGLGAAAAAASPILGDPLARFLLWGELFPNRAGAIEWAAALAAGDPGAVGLVGGSLAGFAAPLLAAAGAQAFEPSGLAQTRVALPMLRHLLTADRLRHDGGTSLSDQARGAVVIASPTGLGMSPRSMRSDLVRAAAWALYRATTHVEPTPFSIL